MARSWPRYGHQGRVVAVAIFADVPRLDFIVVLEDRDGRLIGSVSGEPDDGEFAGQLAEPTNPSIGFYDRMGGERLLDERGVFTGAYGWRDGRTLI